MKRQEDAGGAPGTGAAPQPKSKHRNGGCRAVAASEQCKNNSDGEAKLGACGVRLLESDGTGRLGHLAKHGSAGSTGCLSLTLPLYLYMEMVAPSEAWPEDLGAAGPQRDRMPINPERLHADGGSLGSRQCP